MKIIVAKNVNLNTFSITKIKNIETKEIFELNTNNPDYGRYSDLITKNKSNIETLVVSKIENSAWYQMITVRVNNQLFQEVLGLEAMISLEKTLGDNGRYPYGI